MVTSLLEDRILVCTAAGKGVMDAVMTPTASTSWSHRRKAQQAEQWQFWLWPSVPTVIQRRVPKDPMACRHGDFWAIRYR